MSSKSEYKTLELVGNLKTKSGDQVSEWIPPKVEEMKVKMEEWDWSKPFEFEMPDNALATEFDDIFKENALPDKLPDIGKLVLYDSSKLTDFIKGSFLEQYGLIVSEKAKNIFEQFKIGKHKFYKLTLSHKGIDYNDYYFFKSLTNSNEYIDIKNSGFYLQKGFIDLDNRINIAFASIEEINEFRQNNSDKNIHLFAERIQINQSFPKFDYFTINEFGIYIKVISQQLANRLEGLTGIKLNVNEMIYD